MPFDLSAMLKPTDEKTVTVRGMPIKLRAVLARETQALENQWPPPGPAGEPFNRCDLDTPAGQKELRKYHTIRKVGVVGIAAGFTNKQGEEWTPDRRFGWVDMWVQDILDVFTEAEIAFLYVGHESIASPFTRNERIGTEEKQGN